MRYSPKLEFEKIRFGSKWLRYEHADSGTEIIVAEQNVNNKVRPTEALSARIHLVANGLISEAEFDAFLTNGRTQPIP